MPVTNSPGICRSRPGLVAGLLVAGLFSIHGSADFAAARDSSPAPSEWTQTQKDVAASVDASQFERGLVRLTDFINANSDYGPAYEKRAWVMLDWLEMRDEFALTDTPLRHRSIKDPASDLSNLEPPVEARRIFLEDQLHETYAPPTDLKFVERDMAACRRLMGHDFDDRAIAAFIAEFVGDYDRAKELIGSRCADGTATPREYLTYARVLKSRGDMAGALAAAEVAWKEPETQALAAPRKLNLLRILKRNNEATAFFRLWEATFPRDPRFIYTRSSIALEPNATLKDFVTLTVMMPRESGFFYGLAIRDIQIRNDLEASVTHLNRAVELNSKSLLPLYARSCLHGRLGDFQSALVDATEAIKCSPYFDQSYQIRSKLYQKLGDAESARQDDLHQLWLKQLYDLYANCKSKPRNADAAVALGKHYAKGKDWNLALRTLSSCLKISPRHAGALQQRCQVFVALEKMDLALADASSAVEVAPNAESYSLRGDVHFELENWDGAVSDYDRAKNLDDRLEQALRRRAAWHTANGRAQAANSDLGRANGISQASFVEP